MDRVGLAAAAAALHRATIISESRKPEDRSLMGRRNISGTLRNLVELTTEAGREVITWRRAQLRGPTARAEMLKARRAEQLSRISGRCFVGGRFYLLGAWHGMSATERASRTPGSLSKTAKRAARVQA